MNVISRRRYLIPLQNGDTLNVLVEEQGNPSLYKYAAVDTGWDERCKFSTGNTIEDAVNELADLIDVTLPHDWRNYESGLRAVAAA